MPPDVALTSEQCKAFVAAVRYFVAHPDPRCLPLFVGVVGPGTGLGMYEEISLVLWSHDRRQVTACLRVGLEGSDTEKYRCCWWAADIDAWELAGLVRPLVDHPDVDVQEAALAFLELAPKAAEPLIGPSDLNKNDESSHLA